MSHSPKCYLLVLCLGVLLTKARAISVHGAQIYCAQYSCAAGALSVHVVSLPIKLAAL